MAKRVSFKLYDHEIQLAEQFSLATQTDLDRLAKQCLMFTIQKAYELAKAEQEAHDAEAKNRISEGATEETAQSEASDSAALADQEKSGDPS